jgi:hypothetical protein
MPTSKRFTNKVERATVHIIRAAAPPRRIGISGSYVYGMGAVGGDAASALKQMPSNKLKARTFADLPS